jgi:hypothetical protein
MTIAAAGVAVAALFVLWRAPRAVRSRKGPVLEIGVKEEVSR